MTATIAASAAILKTKYPDGKLPKSQFMQAPFTATIPKKETFGGNNKVIAKLERGEVPEELRDAQRDDD